MGKGPMDWCPISLMNALPGVILIQAPALMMTWITPLGTNFPWAALQFVFNSYLEYNNAMHHEDSNLGMY